MTYLISGLSIEENSVSPLPQFDNKWAVSKSLEEKLISNSCLHRGALLVTEKNTSVRNIVCPIHRWTYDLSGNLLGNPIENPPRCLQNFKIERWNNLLFRGSAPRVDLPEKFDSMFRLDSYVHTKTEIMTVKCNWKIFMEVYLDLYHVRPYHTGLGSFVDMNNYSWHFGNNWSIQEVELTKNPGSNKNKNFRAVEEMISSNYPHFSHGAIWMTIYPNITLEWYPNMIVSSTIWPGKNESESVNVIEYHHLEDVAGFHTEFVDTQMEAYNITAVEDAEICERIQAGRKKQGEEYPTHPKLELGIKKFYEFIESTNNLNVEKGLTI